tara:strand:+ start:477 stop:1553 length:1077 start_codon:yes stop_codon:yes gene_type:complete
MILPPKTIIKIGNCKDVIQTMPENSVQSVITSPPYYGLRDYGTGKWIGGDPKCLHMRTTKIGKTVKTITGHQGMYDQGSVVGDAIYKTTCPKCGAVRDDEQLGLEETPELYISSLVSVFAEVHRVLREDGTVWVNLGDSYYNYRPKGGQSMPKQTVSKTAQDLPSYNPKRANKLHNYKEKDLIGIPWKFAFAMREFGWYLRQDIIWHKPNPMPESVKDRCTKAHEYIFLFSKNKKYYFSNEEIKEPCKYPNDDRGSRGDARRGTNMNSMSGKNGLKKNKRSVWTVTTKPYKKAHFATYPIDLIEPCVLASCPPQRYILDPFAGAGTTGLVAKKNNRHSVLIELNPDYKKLIEERLRDG